MTHDWLSMTKFLASAMADETPTSDHRLDAVVGYFGYLLPSADHDEMLGFVLVSRMVVRAKHSFLNYQSNSIKRYEVVVSSKAASTMG